MSGCCDPCETIAHALSTPEPVANPSGLIGLARRVGRHGSFKAAMLAGIARRPALADLTSRDDDDPAIALIDGWATVLDVLTFYQERIAQESYLRTATERRSVLELARAIGYELGGGVAASALLAFELETAPGAQAEVPIPARVRAQTTPRQDELPQTFETIEPLRAVAAWNRIAPRRRRLRAPRRGQATLLLAGNATRLAVGDRLLVASGSSGAFDVRTVVAVDLPPVLAAADAFTAVALDQPLTVEETADAAVHRLGDPLWSFGHNAPNWPSLPRQFRAEYLAAIGAGTTSADSGEWPAFTTAAVSGGARFLMLDSLQPAARTDLLAVVESAGTLARATIKGTAAVAKSAFGLSARGTLLELDVDIVGASPRQVSIGLAGPPLPLFPEALGQSDIAAERVIAGPRIRLAAAPPAADALRGRLVVVRDAASGAAERAIVDRYDPADGALVLTAALAGAFPPASAEILGNVARGTHGETIRPAPEILGSGDGAKVFQSFALKRRPLTRIRAATAKGSASTLEVRVDGVLWHEVPSFYGRGPEERIHIVRLADDGTVLVRFGDGRTGARLPTGQGNVTATYRSGTGAAGLFEAGRIDQPIDRPQSVKGVSNPLATEGAAEPETLEAARSSAPMGVVTLDRVVSVGDLEAFARAFDGIGKAVVTPLWVRGRDILHLTVTGEAGGTLAQGSDTVRGLEAAIAAAAPDAFTAVVQGYAAAPFGLRAQLRIDPDEAWDAVAARARDALAARFGFAAREFAVPVRASEIIACLEGARGVRSVVLLALSGATGAAAGVLAAGEGSLPAAPAQAQGTGYAPAQLLMIDLAQVTLEVIGS